MKTVFVGDRPSRLNDDPEVAFVGTPSFTNLCKWIAKMQISNFVMVNSYTHGDSVEICRLVNEGKSRFVALGALASHRLNKLSINHFRLPHPSPRNRLLNNRKYVDSELRKCYLYLKDKAF